jgi:preprotein translocase subunit SecF
MSSPEQLPQGPENSVETPRITPEMYDKAGERREALHENYESAEKLAQEALAEARELSLSVEKSGVEKDHNPATAAPARKKGVIPKKESKAAFEKKMEQVQAVMSPSERTFSKFIHAPAVERVSETLGSTVARPNAILAGSIVAFVLVLVVYLTAKYFGYPLSNFETIAAFVVGWALGLLYDFLKTMITGQK